MLKIGSNINEIRVDGSLAALRRDLDAFVDFGLEAAEISIHGLDAVQNGQLDKAKTREIVATLADYPLTYSTHAPNPLNLMDEFQPAMHQEVLRASLAFTAAIGARCMVYHPGRYLAEERFAVSSPLVLTQERRQVLLDREATLLAEAADDFPEVVIAMENARPYLYHSPYCYAERPADLAEQIRRIDRDNVRMTLDFGHLHLAARFYELDEVAEVRRLVQFIAHCHVHDNFGHSVYFNEKIQTHQLPFGRGDSHLPVGRGEIPFAELFAPFIGSYDGLLICELRSRYFAETGLARRNLLAILDNR